MNPSAYSRLFLCLSFMFLLMPLHLSAQSEELVFDFDFARFRASKGYTFLEVYIGIPRRLLDYGEKSGAFEARYSLAVEISRADSVLKSESSDKSDRVNTLAEIKDGQQLYEIYQAYLAPGSFKFTVKIKDLISGRESEHQREIIISEFSPDRLTSSDLQLSLGIERTASKNRFVKNGFRIIPNPSSYYSDALSTLSYYCELYNLSPLSADSDSTFTITVSVRDVRDQVILHNPAKVSTRAGRSVVEQGSFSIAGMDQGVYKIHLEATDMASGYQHVSEKRFYMRKKIDMSNMADVVKANLQSEFADMDAAQIDSVFTSLKYISTKEENKIYEGLDLKGKPEFMANFWLRRDDVPSTAANEFRDAYDERVQMANAQFTVGEKNGWKTDPGRVLIIYGPPDNIEHFRNDTNPYDIWHYDKMEGGVEFVFADLSGYGEFRLIHSTANNELQDFRWRLRLETR